VPVIELANCGTCGSPTRNVKITPPGDYRPAFPHDLEQIRDTVDRQFGADCGDILLPRDKIVVLNKCPGVDRMDEVVLDGVVVGTEVLEPARGWKFVCRIEGGQRITEKVTRGSVVMHYGAVQSMKKGASAMAVGVMEADSKLQVGDEVIMFDEDRNVIATGPARMPGDWMLDRDRGPAVKTRWYKDPENNDIFTGGQTWDDAVKANLPKLTQDIDRSVKWIHKVIERIGKEVAVAFSGGKDSLATLHLVMDAGIKPKVIFVDTGIEFEQTVEHITEITEKYQLALLVEDAGEAYFEPVEYFGPSAKDFRWCCKTCKLGPTAKMIREHFPNGVLSFIGQRQYESENRYQKGGIWVNPWVPGQIGVSPIQKWPSLEVWLYIFYKGESYNELYEKGFERIGCWLCPAADMAEHKELEKFVPRAKEWNEHLRRYAKQHDLPEEWVDMGLWRWRKLPKGMKDYLLREELGHVVTRLEEFESSEKTEVVVQPNMIERVTSLSRITGGVQSEPVIKKALHCTGCGICISRCEQDALTIENKRINLDEEKCISCEKCLHPCPVVDFSPRA
jgi:phosphoadenosine phosphosulfate reductase